MKKAVLFLVIVAFLSQISQAQQEAGAESTVQPTESPIKWYTFEEAVALQEQQPKTIMIDMYTDWCGWCKKMDAETFSHPAIAGYINQNFYPVKFDAERKDSVVYKGTTYTNKGEGRRPPHDLAVQLLHGKMSYPTIVYIDDQFNVNPVPGYLTPDKIEPVLVYFAERIHKSAPFDDFKLAFAEVFQEKKSPPELIKWMNFEDALALNQLQPKKIMIDIYSKFNRGSEIMNKTTLTNPEIAGYINEKFYAVKLEAERTDTITIGEQVFFNEMKVPNYPHQLPIALLGGEMFYPTLLYLDETSKIINKISGYMIPTGLEPILYFIGEDKYKTDQWETFRQSFQSKIQ
ncbi:MAG: DUF255 domain-containing protein [Bacteroidales bacterium]|nr:DUF255 domain-containing protein [Bacteroidales bacterium]MCF8455947.1 DUF255 domain-containing protein [Bacteroidales bacterium]